MTFRYNLRPRPPRSPLNRLAGSSDEGEQLTGFVHGKEASDLEERWARAEDGAQREYIFQYWVENPYGLPSQKNQIDFMDVTDAWQPIEIDGSYAHKTAGQKADDQARDAILNTLFQQRGINPIIRIPGDSLATQEDADRIVLEIFRA